MSGSQQQPANWRELGNWRSASASPSGTPIATRTGNNSAWRRGGGADGTDSNVRPRGGGGRWGSSRGTGTGSNDAADQQQQQREPDAAVTEGRRIYVGNLLYSVKLEDVEELLAAAEFPAYEKIHISADPFSGRNPGYCFVEFADKATADAAMTALDGAPLLGRAIKTGPCRPKGPRRRDQGEGGEAAEEDQKEGRQQQQRGDGGDENRSFNRWADRKAERRDSPRSDNWGRRDGQSESQRPGDDVNQPKKRLYVGGLPQMETQEECEARMREFFTGYEV